MTGARYWWQEPLDDEPEADPPTADAARPRPSRPGEGDPASYREQLTKRALLQPRGSARRRETEKTLKRVTAELLRRELAEGRR